MNVCCNVGNLFNNLVNDHRTKLSVYRRGLFMSGLIVTLLVAVRLQCCVAMWTLMSNLIFIMPTNFIKLFKQSQTTHFASHIGLPDAFTRAINLT